MVKSGKNRARLILERISVDMLKPATYNPRSITDAAKAGLGASIAKFGIVQPIVWNKRTGNVVSGHQRLNVLPDRGDTEADVVVVDLDDADEKALNITQNNPAITGEFTPELQPLLLELEPLCLEFDELLLGDLVDDVPVIDGDFDPKVRDKKAMVCPKCGFEYEE